MGEAVQQKKKTIFKETTHHTHIPWLQWTTETVFFLYWIHIRCEKYKLYSRSYVFSFHGFFTIQTKSLTQNPFINFNIKLAVNDCLVRMQVEQ